ncbi:transcriptional regulator of sorbose uptake and utilization genes [Klebsiella pneumoniae]|uniref:Transcriptional regulator of sorbose uptake and utilization genes n=1 Tax=Klebsiella pneumoniae TaxID=573 RepID=A0A378F6I4_KLEPN|nr:transcriptional regulator of sorbose uptake and utilization genes [Klebsiella pneumoniae]
MKFMRKTWKASGVIQLLGGVGPNGNVQATILTQTLAQRLNCDAWLLPSQASKDPWRSATGCWPAKTSLTWCRALMKWISPSSGIGILEPSQLLKTSGNYYHEDMLQVLAARGAVGDICLHYYDKNGHPVLRDDEDPVIGMALEKVKKCPNVVALAGGTDKVAAIKGALTGGYIDVLITDYPTARMLVSD